MNRYLKPETCAAAESGGGSAGILWHGITKWTHLVRRGVDCLALRNRRLIKERRLLELDDGRIWRRKEPGPGVAALDENRSEPGHSAPDGEGAEGGREGLGLKRSKKETGVRKQSMSALGKLASQASLPGSPDQAGPLGSAWLLRQGEGKVVKSSYQSEGSELGEHFCKVNIWNQPAGHDISKGETLLHATQVQETPEFGNPPLFIKV